MNGLLGKILTGICAIVILWCGSQSALAGMLSDRLAQYPNWDARSILGRSEGELTYPEWFRGRWIATSTLVEQIAPLAPAIVTPGFESNRQYIDKPIEFTVQFVPRDPTKDVKFSPLNLPKLQSNLPAPQIIADRAFNGLNIAAAYLGAANVKSVKIDPQNPTKQITQLTQDRQLEAFVTGFDLEIPAPDRFISTELSQQVFRTSATIYLNTVETTTSYQYSATPIPKITATQISAIYLSPQDPDYFGTRGRAVALYKYRLNLLPASDERR
ncbi:DUF6816 family protein [Chamaesiphon minutus]|uniref:DUF6816 domain-containing protein n=1 Tax=Chamaesiphon minutus (strain ATCC 27169 / PCC 6605) TaxID=1173020 RepID=K9UBR1_CHAP6|nr:hypothetical protein [Chamaesiphon minutus]AFY91861.1 hypothetical protein Cha6605_0578 [Chamaesiphon minutus PCC 6605]